MRILDMVQVLLEHGVDPNTITFYRHGYTKNGHEIPLSLLLRTMDASTGAFGRKECAHSCVTQTVRRNIE